MRKTVLLFTLLATPVLTSLSQEAKAITVDHDDPRLQRLKQFFAKWDCPLGKDAAEFLIASDLNGLDWRLLPSISFVESSGGKDYRNNNVFGWDSCRERFPSVRAGIHHVAAQLANSRLYKNKNLDRKLRTYNPVPGYSRRVKAVMRALALNADTKAGVAD